jgi:hypothetical protein
MHFDAVQLAKRNPPFRLRRVTVFDLIVLSQKVAGH